MWGWIWYGLHVKPDEANSEHRYGMCNQRAVAVFHLFSFTFIKVEGCTNKIRKNIHTNENWCVGPGNGLENT